MVSCRVATLAAASIFLMMAATEASACSCGKTSTEQEQFAEADLVVKGYMKTVTYGIEIPDAESSDSYRMARGDFEIEKVLKGSFGEKIVSIYTGAGLGDCGRLGDFLTAAFYYRNEEFGVLELGLRKSEVAGQTYFGTTICDYAKFPKNNKE